MKHLFDRIYAPPTLASFLVGPRMRKGSTSSARGADTFVSATLTATKRINSGIPALAHGDSG